MIQETDAVVIGAGPVGLFQVFQLGLQGINDHLIDGIGTFFAQATATGFVGKAATIDRGSASGLYLASYFLGGLAGSALLGQVFDRFGWTACVAGIGLSLALGALLAIRLIAPGHRADAATAFHVGATLPQSGGTR